MTIAEKLIRAKEDIDYVYNCGYLKGKEEGFDDGYMEGYDNGNLIGYNQGIGVGIEQGKQAEYDTFWDTFQNNGNAANYYMAFAYGKFTDANYNPKHPIRCSNGATPAQQIFYNSPDITDTKVPIYLNNRDASQAFALCTGLHTIRLLGVQEATSYTNTFKSCFSLAHITIEGTIGNNISFADCPLTVDSAWSVYNALGYVLDKTLIFSKKTYDLLEATPDDTMQWDNDWEHLSYLIYEKGWISEVAE